MIDKFLLGKCCSNFHLSPPCHVLPGEVGGWGEDFDCDLLPHPLTDLLTELVTDEVEAGADCGDVDDYVVVP